MMLRLKYLFVIMGVSIHIALSAATVSGFITRKDSAEPMQYVNVRIVETKAGMQTNKKGYYVINITKPGTYTIEATMISYLPVSQKFTISKISDQMTVDIEMEKSAIELQRIVAVANDDAFDYDSQKIKAGAIRQNTEEIKNVVSVAESDVFRAVLALPGVTPISDFSAGLYVRGGSPDQNLILLDDIDVYNPNHFGGVFSTFSTDAVENIELIKGGYPAQYGGRLSSVLDVTNRQGNRNYHQGVAHWSLISSSATLEGPWKIASEKGSYMVSFRRTYLELLKLVYDLPDYYFYDGNAKVNWDLNASNKINTSVYFGQDRLTFDFGAKLLIDWGNKTFTTQWVHIFNPNLFSNFIIAGSQYQSKFSQEAGESGNSFEQVNGISDLTGKGLLSWKPDNEHQFDFGYEAKFNRTWLTATTDYQYDENSLPDVNVSSLTTSLYAQDVWNPNALWTLQPGLRLTWYKTLDINLPSSPDASYMRIEPRVSVRRKLDVGEQVYVNYGRYYQYLTLMGAEISTPFDMWFPLDGSLKPSAADHYILGYKQEINQYLGVDLELYYKKYFNLLEYNEATSYTWDNEHGKLSDTFHVGNGYTYGADMLLRNDWNGLQGFVGYTFGKTLRKIKDTNVNPETGEPEYFYPKYDKTHQVNIIENYNITENTGHQFLGADFKVGLNFTYTSGQPNEIPERVFFDGEAFQLIYSYKDRKRLPYYMRLDLSTKYEYIKSWGSIEPYFEIINVLNRKNVAFRSYNVVPDDEDNLKIQASDSTQFPFLPFIGVNVKW